VQSFFPTQKVRSDRVIARDYVQDCGVDSQFLLPGPVGHGVDA
jgi:hypothetical protein